MSALLLSYQTTAPPAGEADKEIPRTTRGQHNTTLENCDSKIKYEIYVSITALTFIILMNELYNQFNK